MDVGEEKVMEEVVAEVIKEGAAEEEGAVEEEVTQTKYGEID